MTDIVKSFTTESLRDLLQRFGYRAEIVADEVTGAMLLRSATSGMNFDIRPGNRLADHPAQFVDLSFLGLFKIEGELPLGPLNDWNNARRFSRLHLAQGFLLLDMDVTVAGGVTPDHLRAHLEIWDQLAARPRRLPADRTAAHRRQRRCAGFARSTKLNRRSVNRHDGRLTSLAPFLAPFASRHDQHQHANQHSKHHPGDTVMTNRRKIARRLNTVSATRRCPSATFHPDNAPRCC